jgi:meiotically up-regulated gene 157 (Mug157) protein
MNRRTFITTSGMALLATQVFAISSSSFISQRPPLLKRRFTSKAIEDVISDVKAGINNPELQWLFENCFPNTLDTTVFFIDDEKQPDTFVITGDIDAMWLRDSSAQVWPYLPYMHNEAALQRLVAGVINRQTKCILIDPYANAFYKDNRTSHWHTDHTEMKPFVHERKWEVDSLCYTIRLASAYYQYTGDSLPFGADWLKAVTLILQTFREQQRKTGNGPYHFERTGGGVTDTQCCNGYGKPVKPVGLICSSFRPSDDSTMYQFLVPSNCFAVTALHKLAHMLEKLYPGNALIAGAKAIASEVQGALEQYAIVNHPVYGKIFAYEVDGLGNTNLMDDANLPGLLSLPYMGALSVGDEVYQNTRRFVLSNSNPYFFTGKVAEGVGGPHVGNNMIWPMSVITRALTSTSDDEIVNCIKMLLRSHAGTGFMHEAFHKDNARKFTRSWFAWANTLFGELIVKLHTERPYLLKEL